MTLAQEICNRLHTVALKITDNFCYPCHKVVEGDYCPTCRSDDFMRHLEGVGAGYGTDWVISHLLITRLETVDGEEMFEELLDECYPEVKIGCCTFSPSQVMKELDPVCFNMGVQENLESLADGGQLFEFCGNYYRLEDVEDLIEELEAE